MDRGEKPPRVRAGYLPAAAAFSAAALLWFAEASWHGFAHGRLTQIFFFDIRTSEAAYRAASAGIYAAVFAVTALAAAAFWGLALSKSGEIFWKKLLMADAVAAAALTACFFALPAATLVREIAGSIAYGWFNLEEIFALVLVAAVYALAALFFVGLISSANAALMNAKGQRGRGQFAVYTGAALMLLAAALAFGGLQVFGFWSVIGGICLVQQLAYALACAACSVFVFRMRRGHKRRLYESYGKK